jgi:hypothetical protein
VLCIPRVYPNINESRIRKIFDDLNMGELDRIDVVTKTSEKGDKFNRVFVHFKRWNNSENSNVARERLLNGKEIKIIYDDPWFWKISAYREAATRREPATHQQSEDRRPAYARKPTIAFDSTDDRYQRRRDDSRERPQRNDRRFTTGYPVDMPRRRDDSRERPRKQQNERREEKPVRKFVDVEPNKSSTPPCSPPRQRPDENFIIQTPIDYGIISFPVRKQRVYGKKPEPNTIVIEKEDGEISSKEEDNNTENA